MRKGDDDGGNDSEAPVCTAGETAVPQQPVGACPAQEGAPQQPDTAQPETAQPETAQPETAQPETAQPETAQPETAQPTLRQVYGMMCWMLVDGNRQKWLDEPLGACRAAAQQCPHLAGADPQRLKERLDMVGEKRRRVLEAHGGRAESVPRDTRLFDGGPLFVIVDYALTGRLPQGTSPATLDALLRVHAVGPAAGSGNANVSASASGNANVSDSASANANANAGGDEQQCPTWTSGTGTSWGAGRQQGTCGGPVRCAGDARRQRMQNPHYALRNLPGDHPLMQRAKRLTAAEIKQLQDEILIRKEIAVRDALVLADWTAMRRRELEVKEMRIREFIRAHRDGSLDPLMRIDEYIGLFEDAPRGAT